MIRGTKVGLLRGWMGGGRVALGAAIFVLATSADGAGATAGRAEATTAILLSDIHLDPFFDPAKGARLAAAPAAEWKTILAAPPSEGRAAKFAALEDGCHVRGEDSSYALVASSLAAARKAAPEAGFALVSGDLLAHGFDCKFKALFPMAEPGAYEQFAEKTLAFAMAELRTVAPGKPVFVALGNNDSGCGDYRLDPHSAFLKAVGEQVALGVPETERKTVAESFAGSGSYSAPLPVGQGAARLIVLDDNFLSSKYLTCAGKVNPDAGEAQLDWLEAQLALARQRHERVWVMGHIPPGVDVYTSVRHMDALCGAKGPTMFLSSERLAEVLGRYADVVKLAVFAHTHMDEVRLLPAASGPGVPVKVVSSVSPINGNAPSFTVARVDPATAELRDYQVFAASNATGMDTAWKQEYDWDKAFHASAFNAAAASQEIAGFAADADAKTEPSQAYIHDFTVGASPLLSLVWPQYVCALENDAAEAYKACVCQTGK
jgi:sphingomyelin phosphodiesterase acid-like 3